MRVVGDTMEVLVNMTEGDQQTLNGRGLCLLMLLLYDFGKASLVNVLLVAAIRMSRVDSRLMVHMIISLRVERINVEEPTSRNIPPVILIPPSPTKTAIYKDR